MCPIAKELTFAALSVTKFQNIQCSSNFLEVSQKAQPLFVVAMSFGHRGCLKNALSLKYHKDTIFVWEVFLSLLANLENFLRNSKFASKTEKGLFFLAIFKHPMQPHNIVMTHNSHAEINGTIFVSFDTSRQLQKHHIFSNLETSSVQIFNKLGYSYPCRPSPSSGKSPFLRLSTPLKWE